MIKGSGNFNNLITIETPTESNRTKSNNVTTSWSTYAQPYARVTPIGGRERREADRPMADVSHEIECRYVSGVTTKMRVNWDSRIFNILSTINPDERKINLILQCREVVA